MNLATSGECLIDVKKDAEKPFYGVSIDSLDRRDHNDLSVLMLRIILYKIAIR